MNTTVQVPVVMSAETAALIEELRIRPEIEEMIEHTRRTVPGLESIEVTDWYDHEDDPPTRNIHIAGWRRGAGPTADDRAQEREWFEWSVQRFLPSVKRWVSFRVRYRGRDDR